MAGLPLPEGEGAEGERNAPPGRREIGQIILDNNEIQGHFKELQKFLKNGLYYQSVNNPAGALVSYSNAEAYVHILLNIFNRLNKKLPTSDDNKVCAQYIGKLGKLEQKLLGYIEVLQEKVKAFIRSGGESKKEEKEDWKEKCVSITPRIITGEGAITFADLIGAVQEKILVETSFIKPLLMPNLFPPLSKGILLYGPPGTGKTYLAKAAMTQLQGIDPSIGVLFFDPTGADLKGKYVGETEKKITQAFTCAARAACQAMDDSLKAGGTPRKYISILFIDEFDSIGGDRSADETGIMANSVNTILQMMDGVQSFKNVAVIAATNYPWKLDSAILRRFTNQIMLNIPNRDNILELLQYEYKKSIKLKTFNYWCYCKDNVKDEVFKGSENFDAQCETGLSKKDIQFIPGAAPNSDAKIKITLPITKTRTNNPEKDFFVSIVNQPNGTSDVGVCVSLPNGGLQRYNFKIKGNILTEPDKEPKIEKTEMPKDKAEGVGRQAAQAAQAARNAAAEEQGVPQEQGAAANGQGGVHLTAAGRAARAEAARAVGRGGRRYTPRSHRKQSKRTTRGRK
jgi:SpoVK/Ycf46/Vps4 family AAA+-type ATPase